MIDINQFHQKEFLLSSLEGDGKCFKTETGTKLSFDGFQLEKPAGA